MKSPFIISLPTNKQALIICEQYLSCEHTRFENLILIDYQDLMAADLASFSYEIQDNSCPLPFSLPTQSKNSWLANFFLKAGGSFFFLPNRVFNPLFLRFVCQFLYPDSCGNKIYLAKDRVFTKYIFDSGDGYLISYHQVNDDNCFYDEYLGLNDDISI